MVYTEARCIVAYESGRHFEGLNYILTILKLKFTILFLIFTKGFNHYSKAVVSCVFITNGPPLYRISDFNFLPSGFVVFSPVGPPL